MNEWWMDPKVWAMAGSIIGNAAVTWWRVRTLEDDVKALKADVKALNDFKASGGAILDVIKRKVLNGGSHEV